MKWEYFEGGTLRRSRVPFGWLVIYQNSVITELYQEVHHDAESRDSICYVFDPFKKWRP